jgi:hypothetical protein
MHESLFVIGRSWGGAPMAWKMFYLSLPTHAMLKLCKDLPQKTLHKAHTKCIQKTLAQFDAEYLRASNRHPARIRFHTQEGRTAWELTYG